MMHSLHRSLVLPTSIEEAWEFFSNPSNLSRITPPNLRMEVRSNPQPEMYAGMFIVYTVRPILGVPLEWVSEITHVKRPHYFVDEQRLGPYRLWHHEHRFTPHTNGVEVEDIVQYVLPFGPLAEIIHPFLVRRKLDEIFDYRGKILREIFGVS